MSNMHYCRFRNTANDFDDCVVALRDNEYEYLWLEGTPINEPKFN